MRRLGTILGVIAVSACTCTPDPILEEDAGLDCGGEAHLDLPLRTQVDQVRSGERTGTSLVEGYLERVVACDSVLNAIYTIDPEAHVHAEALDAANDGGAALQGAVILVKDNIDAAGFATTGGALALVNNVASTDAEAVRRLRAANALVYGKANLTELASLRDSEMRQGWSTLGDQTVNARDITRSPCGSSSGSAAAVAAGLASAALGTETNGSIICPASANGVVGFKPTVGLVSRRGMIPVAASFDTVGPITRTVGDAARLLSVIAAPDAQDPAVSDAPSELSLDFESPLGAASLSGKRLGYVHFGYAAPVLALFDAERTRLEAAGATVVDVQLDPVPGTDARTVVLHEFKAGLNAYLDAHPIEDQPRSLQGLIDFNVANSGVVLHRYGQDTLIAAQQTTGLDAATYQESLGRIRTVRTRLHEVLVANDLDAFITPSLGPAWVLSDAGDPQVPFAWRHAAFAGAPHLTVPMGEVEGLPVGLSIFGARWDDAKVLAIGHAYEQLPR